MKDIKLIAPFVVGRDGVPPEGNLKYELNPTFAVPEFSILRVWLSASVPPAVSYTHLTLPTILRV